MGIQGLWIWRLMCMLKMEKLLLNQIELQKIRQNILGGEKDQLALILYMNRLRLIFSIERWIMLLNERKTNHFFCTSPYPDNTLVIFTSDNGCSPEADFEVLGAKGHNPSYIYRGHKADIYEGGHRVPFIAKWPKVIAKGQTTDQLICSTDLMATCADLVGYPLAENEGEDSYSLLPFFKNKSTESSRKEVIHHSINGRFAIRAGDWKLIMDAGSAGWSFPNPRQVNAIDTLPAVQLYNLKIDPAETNNLQAAQPEKVAALKKLLATQIRNGRSTTGTPQKNDAYKGDWKQVAFIKE